MFINLTNHPSSLWDRQQTEEARNIGQIIDMPFPVIPPDAGKDAIQSLAEEYAAKIAERAGEGMATVHVMGEMTFTFAVVTLLKARGFRCVASTTVRDTECLPDGKRVSTFRFVQFREY